MKRRIKDGDLYIDGKKISCHVENWNIRHGNFCPRCEGVGEIIYEGPYAKWRIIIPCKTCKGKGFLDEAMH